MKPSRIIENVQCAIKDVLEYDKYLLEKRVSERAVCHRLAVYLERYFRGYDVDCEYNKQHNVEPKAMDHSYYLVYEKAKKNYDKEKDDYEPKLYPDIIVHRRGSDKENLLVIEVKYSDAPTDAKKWDKVKLKYLTSEEFNYKLGIWIEFEKGKSNKEKNLYFYREGKKRKIEDLLD